MIHKGEQEILFDRKAYLTDYGYELSELEKKHSNRCLMKWT
jgi:hypothetical protein